MFCPPKRVSFITVTPDVRRSQIRSSTMNGELGQESRMREGRTAESLRNLSIDDRTVRFFKPIMTVSLIVSIIGAFCMAFESAPLGITGIVIAISMPAWIYPVILLLRLLGFRSLPRLPLFLEKGILLAVGALFLVGGGFGFSMYFFTSRCGTPGCWAKAGDGLSVPYRGDRPETMCSIQMCPKHYRNPLPRL